MEGQISWSKLADQDLTDIFDYIKADSEKYANKTVDAIYERVLSCQCNHVSEGLCRKKRMNI